MHPASSAVTAQRPVAVLWDMDGTIVDTEAHWIDAADEVLREQGIASPPGDLAPLVGMALTDGAKLMRNLGASGSIDELVQRQLELATRNTAASELRWRPGAVAMLAGLRASGIRLALVTMSYRSYAEAIIAALPAGTFDVVVTGDEVERGKPAPDAYLRAAELLGVSPQTCIAIEDSPIGVAAARAAGVRTIGVPHHLDIAADAADEVWSTLEGRSPEELRLG